MHVSYHVIIVWIRKSCLWNNSALHQKYWEGKLTVKEIRHTILQLVHLIAEGDLHTLQVVWVWTSMKNKQCSSYTYSLLFNQDIFKIGEKNFIKFQSNSKTWTNAHFFLLELLPQNLTEMLNDLITILADPLKAGHVLVAL